MTPLQLFLSGLLQRYHGGLELVVDNAHMTTKVISTQSPSMLGTIDGSFHIGGSNHSCNRWETDEPSPTRATDCKVKNRVVPLSTPSLQRRPPLVILNNSSPACPIRKLSPKVPPELITEAANFEISLLSPVSGHAMKGKSPLTSFESNLEVFRPPLSPRKASANNAGSSSTDCTRSNKVALTKKRISDTKPLRPPVRIRSRPEDYSARAANSPDGTRTELLPLRIAPAQRPTRGLSQTLLGINVTEQAPICPMRKPSTQPDKHSPATPEKSISTLVVPVSLEKVLAFSAHSHSTMSTASSNLSSPRESNGSLPMASKQLVVLPPAPELRSSAGSPSSSSDKNSKDTSSSSSSSSSSSKKSRGVGRPVFFHRLTKRR